MKLSPVPPAGRRKFATRQGHEAERTFATKPPLEGKRIIGCDEVLDKAKNALALACVRVMLELLTTRISLGEMPNLSDRRCGLTIS